MSRRPSSDPVHTEALRLVNKNLQYDQKHIELRERSVEFGNDDQLAKIKQRGQQWEADQRRLIPPHEVVVEDGSRRVLEDLEPKQPIYNSELSPSEKIDLQLIRERENQEYQRRQRTLFVEEFLENARKNGYLITLNDKLEIVSIKRVRKDQPYRGEASIQDLFSGSAGGGGN